MTLNQTVELDITDFWFFWHSTIQCDDNCDYFQFRRNYVGFLKESFQQVFLDMVGLVFEQGGDYFF